MVLLLTSTVVVYQQSEAVITHVIKAREIKATKALSLKRSPVEFARHSFRTVNCVSGSYYIRARLCDVCMPTRQRAQSFTKRKIRLHYVVVVL